jgi:hypothetical protein
MQEPEKAVDYATQTLNELDKVQSKAILLNDMLNNAREGEKVGLEGDAYEQVAQACRGARPKIQKWIEQDTGEREGMMGESKTGRGLEKVAYCQIVYCFATILSTPPWSGTRRVESEIGPKRKRWLRRES